MHVISKYFDWVPPHWFGWIMRTPFDCATCRFTTKLIPCRVSAQRIEHCTNLHMNSVILRSGLSNQSYLKPRDFAVLQKHAFLPGQWAPNWPWLPARCQAASSICFACHPHSFLSLKAVLGLESVTTLPRVAFKGAPKPLQATRPRSAHLRNKVNSAMLTWKLGASRVTRYYSLEEQLPDQAMTSAYWFVTSGRCDLFWDQDVWRDGKLNLSQNCRTWAVA